MSNTKPNANNRRKRIVRIGIAALFALLVLGVFLRPKPAPQLLTAVVARGDLERTVVATGTVEARHLVSVGAQASGRIESLKVELGDQVKAGQLIAEIDATSQRNALRNAEAGLVNIRAQRAGQYASTLQTESAFRRQAMMIAEDATSRAEFEAARASYAASKAQLQAIDAQIAQSATTLDNARANLGYTRVLAPSDGTVVAIIAQEGQTLNAVQSSPTIVKLAKLDMVTVEAEISEADVIHVNPGQMAYFTILGDPDRRFPGVVRSIKPAPESLSEDNSRGASSSSSSDGDKAVYYHGLFDVPNPDGILRISMTANVNIVLDRTKNALLVPLAALSARGRDGSYNVQALDEDDKPVVRNIRVGINDQINAQVLSGLREGERVVIGEAKPEAKSSVFPPEPPQNPALRANGR